MYASQALHHLSPFGDHGEELITFVEVDVGEVGQKSLFWLGIEINTTCKGPFHGQFRWVSNFGKRT